MSAVLAQILSMATGKPVMTFCSLTALRALNLAFGIGIYAITLRLLGALHPEMRHGRWTSALAITAFPVLAFFYHLYYTDAGSVFFILLAYHFALKRRFYFSALVRLNIKLK